MEEKAEEWYKGINLEVIMRDNKITQKELAEATGISQSCISSYVNRYGTKYKPSLKSKTKLYEYFSKHPEYTEEKRTKRALIDKEFIKDLMIFPFDRFYRTRLTIEAEKNGIEKTIQNYLKDRWLGKVARKKAEKHGYNESELREAMKMIIYGYYLTEYKEKIKMNDVIFGENML